MCKDDEVKEDDIYNMIHNYDKWRLIESFGNGEETFTVDIEMYGKLSNLDIINFPDVWGELEGANGTLVYIAELDVNSSGIDDVYFRIESIAIEMEIRVYKKPTIGAKYGIDDIDEEGELIYKELIITEDMINTDVKTEVGKLPYYMNNLEINFVAKSGTPPSAVDKDGNIDYKKLKFEMQIGE